MYKIDKKDKQIIYELDKNSRISINEIAKSTRLSRDVVAYRMKQLKKNGIINKYITIVDFSKFGLQIIRLYIKLQNTTPEIEKEMINFFLTQKNNLTVYKIDGHYDLAVGFLVKDLHIYQKCYEEFLDKYRTYVSKKSFSVFSDYIHFHRNYLAEKKDYDFNEFSTGSFIPFDYDSKDIELLNLIKEDSRRSLLELSKKLNMTAAGVKYKLRTLEKNKVIVAYKILLDLKKLGYEYYKVDLELEDISIIPSLKQYIKEHPNIIYQNVVVGGSDFEFDCELKSQHDFYKIIDEIRYLFPRKVRNYFYYKSTEIFKYTYFPDFLEKKENQID